MARVLTLGISPCPNDTFAFHQLLAEHASEYELVIDDVEALNGMAAAGQLDIAKVSVAAFGHLRPDYALLHAGGAAGFGVGPLLVAREEREPGGRIAIPGERTTAALLLRLLGSFETVAMRFDRIEAAVLAGDVDAGVLIHEGRFTYAARGLVRLRDLGEEWDRRFHVPLPLGAIAVRRAMDPAIAGAFDRRLRASVDFALAHPEASAEFVRAHAQEMDPEVVRRHIELYVNDYTRAMDPDAVETLLRFGVEQGRFPACDAPLFAAE
ncbi:MAG: MqnA/MqnD/SBP family protein [Planctomycetota bacterium]|jgi:1,4-dihydroxy-6-naphthoate synthase